MHSLPPIHSHCVPIVWNTLCLHVPPWNSYLYFKVLSFTFSLINIFGIKNFFLSLSINTVEKNTVEGSQELRCLEDGFRKEDIQSPTRMMVQGLVWSQDSRAFCGHWCERLKIDHGGEAGSVGYKAKVGILARNIWSFWVSSSLSWGRAELLWTESILGGSFSFPSAPGNGLMRDLKKWAQGEQELPFHLFHQH